MTIVNEKENSKDKLVTPNTDNIWLMLKIMESNFLTIVIMLLN